MDYPIHQLIKCCGRYPVYRSKPNGDTWVECECCRKRTVNTFKDKDEASRIWNITKLRVRDPLRTLSGRTAMLSLIDEDGMNQIEVAEKIGVPKDQIGMIIKRAREKVEDIYGTDQDGWPRGTPEGGEVQPDDDPPGFG